MLQMNKLIKQVIAVFLISVMVLSGSVPTYAKTATSKIQLSLTGKSAVIMDMDSGKILYAKNANTKRHNASTTKLATAIVAVEKSKSLKKKIRISDRACYNGSSSDIVKLGMRNGDSYYLKDLLHAMLIKSANDASVAIAEGISGSEAKFMKQVNKKVKKLGCKNTVFGTPNGLRSAKTHYTTAKDLALIMRYAYQNETIRSILKKKRYTFKSVGGRSHTVNSTNFLLNNKAYYCIGKTGNGETAKYCYTGVYTYKKHSYVIVTLGNETDAGKWNDAKKMITACKKHAKEVQKALKLNKSYTELYVGATKTLKVKGCKGKIAWSSKNKKVATVDKNGVVTGKKIGNTVICAKVYGKTLKCKIQILKDVNHDTSSDYTIE